MGGNETDLNGLTRVAGLWAAGEAACVSLHGANRLGSNSTAECLVWGGITGAEIAKALEKQPSVPALPDRQVEAARRRVDDLLARDGGESLYELRKELRATMDAKMGVFRTGEGMKEALEKVREIKKRSLKAGVADKSRTYNTNLFHALELENLVDLAEVAVAGALAREESRGAHARRDFPTRDDAKWLKHTLCFREKDGVRLDYKPVTIDTWKPVERKY